MQSFDVLTTDVLKIQFRNIRDAYVVVIVAVHVGPPLHSTVNDRYCGKNGQGFLFH